MGGCAEDVQLIRGPFVRLFSRRGRMIPSRPAMNTTGTTLRPVWNGHPVELGIGWTLRKRNHVAQCVVFSHEFGWELRLEVGELFRTQVCRSDREIEDVSAAWREAMLEKGWTE